MAIPTSLGLVVTTGGLVACGSGGGSGAANNGGGNNNGGGGNGSPLPVCGKNTNARFAITDLGANVVPVAINATGAIVARVQDSTGNLLRAVVIQNGQFTTLGGPVVNVDGINDLGQVVGGVLTANGTHAALWQPGHYTSAPQDLGTLPGDQTSFAVAINNAGTIIGNAQPAGPGSQAVFWKSGQTAPTQIPGLSGSNFDGMLSINKLGQAVGSSTLGIDPVTELPKVEYFQVDTNAASPTALDLSLAGLGALTGGAGNDRAYISGNGVIVVGTSAYKVAERQPNGQVTTLDTASINSIVVPTGINDSGQVALNGGSELQIAGGSPNVAALFDPSSGALDLNTQISATCGWTLDTGASITTSAGASGVNDAGQIIGTGLLNGKPHGFLLTPNTPG